KTPATVLLEQLSEYANDHMTETQKGDAILKNLEIKENALSQLDLPFKVKVSHIERLELKIPWKNLYTQSVEATLNGVYLLIVPTASIKYDVEKEDKQFLEARQRELQRIEETKLKAAEQENPSLEKQDTFVEKLVTQVIKNLQVKISNMHVRYEDDVTNPNCVQIWVCGACSNQSSKGQLYLIQCMYKVTENGRRWRKCGPTHY
uniref:Chorein N-terminal domain-containing protein n=1 Tax=Periophthalmus magnuspinnatus TaxID=409849 RepID=A0A3B4AXD7_9GOBI